MQGENNIEVEPNNDIKIIKSNLRESYDDLKLFTFKEDEYVTTYVSEVKDMNNGHVVIYKEKGIQCIDYKPCKYSDIKYKCELNRKLYELDHISLKQLHPMYTYAIYKHLNGIDVSKHKNEALQYNVHATNDFDIVIINTNDPNDESRYEYKKHNVA